MNARLQESELGLAVEREQRGLQQPGAEAGDAAGCSGRETREFCETGDAVPGNALAEADTDTETGTGACACAQASRKERNSCRRAGDVKFDGGTARSVFRAYR